MNFIRILLIYYLVKLIKSLILLKLIVNLNKKLKRFSFLKYFIISFIIRLNKGNKI